MIKEVERGEELLVGKIAYCLKSKCVEAVYSKTGAPNQASNLPRTKEMMPFLHSAPDTNAAQQNRQSGHILTNILRSLGRVDCALRLFENHFSIIAT